MENKRLICITGGIASGKSVVAGIIKRRGGFVISADDINRELLEDKAYIEKLRSIYPDSVKDDKIDRAYLRDLIINSSKERAVINSLAHPIIKHEILVRAAASGEKTVFVEVPLLAESGMVDIFDEVWAIYADENVRMQRAMIRDNVDEESAMGIIRAQAGEDERRKLATYIIENNGSYDELCGQVEVLYKNVLKGL